MSNLFSFINEFDTLQVILVFLIGIWYILCGYCGYCWCCGCCDWNDVSVILSGPCEFVFDDESINILKDYTDCDDCECCFARLDESELVDIEL